MSGGGYMDKPVWPQRTFTQQPGEDVEYPNPLELDNPRYHVLLQNYFKCVTFFLNDFD
jgi:hypothetical protein